MDAIGADQDIAAHGLDVVPRSIEEMRGDAAFVLRERAETVAGMDEFLAEALFDRVMDHALQPAAMDRELRHVVAGVDAADVAPDLLAVAVEVIKHVGADRDVVELLQQAELGEFTDRMRQRVDADAEFADGIGLFEQLAADAAGAQHQGRGQAADTAADDNRLHRLLLHTVRDKRYLPSHGALFGGKRLCGLRLELGPGLRLSLNFKVFEVLPVPYAIAENLILAGQILRRAERIARAVPGGRLHREAGIDQMRAAERD